MRQAAAAVHACTLKCNPGKPIVERCSFLPLPCTRVPPPAHRPAGAPARFLLSYTRPMQYVKLALWSRVLRLMGAPVANQLVFMLGASLLSLLRVFYYGESERTNERSINKRGYREAAVAPHGRTLAPRRPGSLLLSRSLNTVQVPWVESDTKACRFRCVRFGTRTCVRCVVSGVDAPPSPVAPLPSL